MCLLNKKEYSSDQIIRFIKTKKESFWLKVKEERAFEIFKRASKNIPAYGNFLKKNKANLNKIKNYEDFKFLPLVSKKNYLREYDLEKLSCKCLLSKETIFTATSGSTGAPFYFPRGSKLDWQYSVISKLFFKNGLLKEDESSLVIVGFGMGVWIGGLITYQAFEILSRENNYPISIITPGINKQEIFNALKNLSPHYKQTILAGYPPFIKDIIDEAPSRGIDLKKLNLRLLFAAETFTEKFRDYLVKKAGIKNLYLDTFNIYGSADIGAMAFETPISILIRRLALKRKELFRALFSDINKTPTLVQYIPLFIDFEEVNGEIVLTGDNVIPLVRYSIGDRGGVFTFGEIKEKLSRHGFDLEKEAKRAGIENHIYELPFVYVYERTDFSVKLHLREIFPEIIRDALMHNTLNQYLTGKFTITTKYNNKSNQYLEINIEVIKDKIINEKLKKLIHKRILEAMYLKSVGPGNPAEFIKKPNLIKLIFWPAEDQNYFKPGVKQKWAVKENSQGIKTEEKNPKLLIEVKKIIKKSKIKVAA